MEKHSSRIKKDEVMKQVIYSERMSLTIFDDETADIELFSGKGQNSVFTIDKKGAIKFNKQEVDMKKFLKLAQALSEQ